MHPGEGGTLRVEAPVIPPNVYVRVRRGDRQKQQDPQNVASPHFLTREQRVSSSSSPSRPSSNEALLGIYSRQRRPHLLSPQPLRPVGTQATPGSSARPSTPHPSTEIIRRPSSQHLTPVELLTDLNNQSDTGPPVGQPGRLRARRRRVEFAPSPEQSSTTPASSVGSHGRNNQTDSNQHPVPRLRRPTGESLSSSSSSSQDLHDRLRQRDSLSSLGDVYIPTSIGSFGAAIGGYETRYRTRHQVVSSQPSYPRSSASRDRLTNSRRTNNPSWSPYGTRPEYRPPRSLRKTNYTVEERPYDRVRRGGSTSLSSFDSGTTNDRRSVVSHRHSYYIPARARNQAPDSLGVSASQNARPKQPLVLRSAGKTTAKTVVDRSDTGGPNRKTVGAKFRQFIDVMSGAHTAGSRAQPILGSTVRRAYR